MAEKVIFDDHGLPRIVPVLSIDNFPVALARLVRATDAELEEWDRRLPVAMEQNARERQWDGRARGAA